MNENRSSTAIDNIIDILGCDLCLALEDDLITLYGHHLTGILIDEVLIPRLHHVTGKLRSNSFFQVLLVNLYLLAEIKDLKNILIALEADGTEQRGYRQLLLTVDVSIHDIVDVGSELNPRAFERYDTCAVKHSTIGMNALSEEYAR